MHTSLKHKHITSTESWPKTPIISFHFIWLNISVYCFQEEARADSYRYAVQPGEDGADKPAGAKAAPAKKKGKKKKKGEDLDNLKQEMEMDEHKISIEELCARYGTDITKVTHNLLKVWAILDKRYCDKVGLFKSYDIAHIKMNENSVIFIAQRIRKAL